MSPDLPTFIRDHRLLTTNPSEVQLQGLTPANVYDKGLHSVKHIHWVHICHYFVHCPAISPSSWHRHV
jgi:hypothetical protein